MFSHEKQLKRSVMMKSGERETYLHYSPYPPRSLLAICYLKLAICYLLFAFCYLLFAIWYMLFAICYLVFAICYFIFAICYLLLDICYLPFAICYLNRLFPQWHRWLISSGPYIRPDPYQLFSICYPNQLPWHRWLIGNPPKSLSAIFYLLSQPTSVTSLFNR